MQSKAAYNRPTMDLTFLWTPPWEEFYTIHSFIETILNHSLRKGIHSIHDPSPHYVASSYHHLSHSHYACISSLAYVSIPKIVGDALSHLGWRQARIDEMYTSEL